MDFNLTDEQELLIESVNEFVARNFTEEKIAEWYEAGNVPDELTREYLEAGFGFMGLPEEYGGVPCDKLTLGIMTEALFRATGCITPFTSNTLAMSDIVEFGNEEQIKMCLDSYKENGKPIFSLAISEPGAGSDNMSMSSVTKKQADGTYILSGTKTWVTMGEHYPMVLAVAKDEDPSRENSQMSMWLFSKDLAGVSTAPLHKIGQTITPFCEMYFDDVVLTEDMRVGEPGSGFMNLMKNFEMERSLMAAQSIGLAQAAMDDAAAYASERVCFNKPISSFQMIQLKLTEMETVLQNARNMLYKTLWKMDNGMSVQIDSALLKRYAGMNCTWVASEALQIFAGLGYTTETRVGRIWEDCRGNELGGGTDEIMVYIAGRQLAKKYKK